jgi:hypothetical protein
MNFLKLGILYNNEIIINHRSLPKVILNPILRYFGFFIGSEFQNNKFIRYNFNKCPKVSKIKYTLKTNDYNKIIFKNII